MSNAELTPEPIDLDPRIIDIRTLDSPVRAAVSYVRVSTKEQAERGGRDEGFSIPAQRLANQRKAAAMGAVIVAEFVDAGESARKADRPQLQAMLEYITENDITYCIVHKVDRLARNRVDDVEINLALGRSGVKLVSVSENIDETPSGMLLHGIMSTIAEFYSRNLASEVSKGLTQKAMSGGTISRAPIGYKNVRHVDSVGRENRTVEVDMERAPHVRWAFDTYASGDWSISMLQEELTRRGLRTRPTPKRTAKPLETSNLHEILRNPYYIGDITYRGNKYDGTHEPIIDKAVWQRVQEVLAAHNTAGDRQRTHEHYLKGSVFCGSCGSRLMLTNAKNRHGVVYDYFVCIGRHQKRTDCTRQAMRVDAVATVVEKAWIRLRLTYEERLQAEDLITKEFSQLASRQGNERTQLEGQREALLAERAKLLAAHYADAIPLGLLKIEQDRIAASLAIIDEQLDGSHTSHKQIMGRLDSILNLLQHCHTTYMNAGAQLRRVMNQAFAEKIYIDEEGTAEFVLEDTIDVIYGAAFSPLRTPAIGAAGNPEAPELTKPPPDGVATIPPTERHMAERRNPRRPRSSGVSISANPGSSLGKGLNTPVLVDPRGFEPLTPCMPCRCATSCATDPDNLSNCSETTSLDYYTSAPGANPRLVSYFAGGKLDRNDRAVLP